MAFGSGQKCHLLNEKLDRNFADFINSYRIEGAKKILQTSRGAQRKISAIAIEVGFNTMAAFYKAFKKHTGTTPTRFKKKDRMMISRCLQQIIKFENRLPTEIH